MPRTSESSKKISSFIETIQAAMEEQGVSVYALAKSAGISHSSLYNMLQDKKWGQQVKMLINLCDLLGYDVVMQKRTKEQPE